MTFLNYSGIKKVKEKLRTINKNDYIIFFLIGILLLIIAIPTGDKKEKESQIIESSQEKENVNLKNEEYSDLCEKRLEEMLKKMDGVGKVKVMVTVKNDGNKIIDKNSDVSNEERKSETVLYDEDDNTKPYVTSNEYPQIEGVLVVAQGGGNPSVNAQISDAIFALFDVELHKIKIVKMS